MSTMAQLVSYCSIYHQSNLSSGTPTLATLGTLSLCMIGALWSVEG